MKSFSVILVLIGLSISGIAQDNYFIQKASGPILIDGVLDDEAWTNIESAGNFTQYFPYDSLPAESQTEFMITYDDQYLYFGAKMYNLVDDREYVVSSLRRDYRGTLDGITLVIDPFQDNTNAFQFGINPYGVQREGLIANGGQRGNDLSLSWDNKWVAEARREKGYWIAEAAIPFKTLRFKDGVDKWNINVYRIDTQTGERSTWTPIPRNFIILSLAFMREAQWDQPLKNPGANISVIPYIAGGGTQDFEAEDTSVDGNRSIGGDAKIALGPGLNLDLTINPDFSQVELDEQVTNLDRFELFFPERRQFFLENADLFQDAGHPFLARPFFSRRIGIARDTATGVNLQNKIHYGARLSGKLDNNTRIGLLNMQADKDEAIGLPSLNYTVGVIQRKVFARSNIGAIFVNKESFENNSELDSANRYNRVLGFDYNIRSADGKWNGKVFHHQSFDNEREKDAIAQTAWLGYQSRTWQFSWAHVYIGQNYNAEAGFVPRTGLFRINPDLGYNIFPSSGIFTQHNITAQVEYFWRASSVDDQFRGVGFFWNTERMTDELWGVDYTANFLNTARLQLGFARNYTYLQNDFDPTRTDGVQLAEGTGYTYHSMTFNYRSDMRKLLSYTLQGSLGQYFNGNRYNLRTTLNYRFQPYVAIRLNVDYNRIQLPEPYNDADLFLIGPRFDLTLTKKLFFTNFIQYNSQLNNVNINARFQYRYAPVSDLFIVYTDNYNTDPMDQNGWSPVNRALILKLTYWFNP